MPRVISGHPEVARHGPATTDPTSRVRAPQTPILDLQQSIGNRAVTQLVQARAARQAVAEEQTAGGKPVTSRAVQKGIRVVPPGQLAATLGLPPHTVPPGAEANPDFIRSLFDPDADAYRLEEVHGLSSEVVESLPEGELVEVSGIHMPVITKTVGAAEGIEHATTKSAELGNEAAHALEHHSK